MNKLKNSGKLLEIFRNHFKKNEDIVYYHSRIKILKNYFSFRNNLETKMRKLFIRNVGYHPNFENPKSFNEKLQWLKLNWHDPLATICADKFTVRNYVKEKGLEHILPKLYGVYEKVSDIDFDNLPNKFVLKASHGSGMTIICRDKSKLNVNIAKKKLKRWLKLNYYYLNGEWVYKDCKPRIICEKLIESEDKRPPKDYKFFCFNGKPEFLFVASDRGIATKFDFFTCEWEHIPVKQHYPNSEILPEKPKRFAEMLKISEKLAEGFPHVRIDLYNENGKIIFGEMTFFHFSGTQPFEPVKYDFEFGKYIKLPSN